jgi:hypothetical protein
MSLVILPAFASPRIIPIVAGFVPVLWNAERWLSGSKHLISNQTTSPGFSAGSPSRVRGFESHPLRHQRTKSKNSLREHVRFLGCLERKQSCNRR